MSAPLERTAGERIAAGILFAAAPLFFVLTLLQFILGFLAWPFGELKYAVQDLPGVPQVRAVQLTAVLRFAFVSSEM